jgi:hypothetical protein
LAKVPSWTDDHNSTERFKGVFRVTTSWTE